MYKQHPEVYLVKTNCTIGRLKILWSAGKRAVAAGASLKGQGRLRRQLEQLEAGS